MLRCWLALSITALILPGAALHAQALPKRHTSKDPYQCERCRRAYDKAMAHTLRRLQGAGQDQPDAGDSPEEDEANYDYFNAPRFPAKMIIGWLLLADGQHPAELRTVIDRAIDWKKDLGENKAHNHRWNWHPALAGMLLVEYAKHHPSRRVHDAVKGIVAHFVRYQEDTGGWFKSYHGATGYPVRDLGFLDGLIYGFLRTARAQGIPVVPSMLVKAEQCLARITGGGGISYGTGQNGPDKTGGRGGLALRGLLYAGDGGHRIARTYRGLLPRRIPNMHQGHHVGGLHAWSVVLGCHSLGSATYRRLTAHWLDRLLARQKKDGGFYVGDDEDAGGEEGLLGADDTSTAAVGLLILLQDPTRLSHTMRPRINWLSLVIDPPGSRSLKQASRLAITGKLDRLLDLARRAEARTGDAHQTERTEAAVIREALTTFAQARLKEAEANLKQGGIERASEILTQLARTLKTHPIGTSARKTLDRIKTDPAIKREREAQAALAQAWKATFSRGREKSAPAFENVVKKFAGTAASRRARQMLEPATGER